MVRTAKIVTVPIGATRSLGFLDADTRNQVGALVQENLKDILANVG